MNWISRRRNAIAFYALLFTAMLAYSEPSGQRRTVANGQAKQSFAGAWQHLVCIDPDGTRCGGFSLYLVQKGDRLCGEHSGSTMGFGQIDNRPRSISGSVQGDTATVLIRSGRSKTVYRARMRLRGGELEWTLLEMVVRPENVDTVIPDQDRLTKLSESEYLEKVEQRCK
jgi:hypothetical protein